MKDNGRPSTWKPKSLINSSKLTQTQMDTPVVLIIFKRPHTTQRVFDAIRQAAPKKLFIIADGARSEVAGEAIKCTQARAIVNQIDWECEVLRNYSDVNLGAGKRIASGLDWVFEQVEEAIILEDDCLPHPTFFSFCQQLLERYRFNDRISSISAQNFYPYSQSSYSYYFSHHPHPWGWATWRRAWQQYDFTMSHWQTVQADQVLDHILQNPNAVKRWTSLLQAVEAGHIDAWDYQWILSCWLNGSLSIHPSVHLVENLGFGADATNTHEVSGVFARMQAKAIAFPLNHPPLIVRDVKADAYIQKKVHEWTIFQTLELKARRLIKSCRQILNVTPTLKAKAETHG
jgi:hypothetical protein